MVSDLLLDQNAFLDFERRVFLAKVDIFSIRTFTRTSPIIQDSSSTGSESYYSAANIVHSSQIFKKKIWSVRASISPPLECESSALPNELTPRIKFILMYNNIGLMTPRGSGTSGYVQKNLAHIKRLHNRDQFIKEM